MACSMFGTKPLSEPNAELLSIALLLGTNFKRNAFGIVVYKISAILPRGKGVLVLKYSPSGLASNCVSNSS